MLHVFEVRPWRPGGFGPMETGDQNGQRPEGRRYGQLRGPDSVLGCRP